MSEIKIIGRDLDYLKCMNSLRRRDIIKNDKRGEYIDTKLCGNKTWGMIDFIEKTNHKRYRRI